MDLSTSATVFFFSAVAYILWHLLRPTFVKSTLTQIPCPPRKSWLTGHFFDLYNLDAWDFHRQLAEKYGSTLKVYGFFGEEQLYTTDPRAMQHIFLKDQDIFEETEGTLKSNDLVFGPSLISTVGDQHRRQRKVLNPVFSIKHMRGLTDIFYSIAHQLEHILTEKVRDGEQEVDMLEWSSRAAMEYIGQGGFGYSFDALDRSKTNAYAVAIRDLTTHLFTFWFLREYMQYIVRLGSAAFRRTVVNWMPLNSAQSLKNLINLMHDQSREIYEDRKKHIKNHGTDIRLLGQGKDMLSVMMRANMAADVKDQLPDNELFALMNILIFAGHDTTTSALSRALHMLAIHEDVQERLRSEVSMARKIHGDMDYDTLMSLPILDSVCRETLRFSPPVSMLTRVTTKDAVLPLQFPVKSADEKTEIRELSLKKNTLIQVCVHRINRNKEIWGEDAEEWKPGRWLQPLPESVTAARLPGVYSSLMTFIGGSRACIGFKFAELEMKLVLSVLLGSFVFSPSDKEIKWNMGPIVTPSTKDTPAGSSELPLRVALV